MITSRALCLRRQASRSVPFIALLIGGVALCSCGPTTEVRYVPVDETLPLWQRNGDGPVTRVYGGLTVREGVFDAESPVQPWSGYWFPVSDPVLFKGEEAPLRKYDAWVRTAKGQPSGAAEFEEAFLWQERAEGWEGLCNAWSKASLLEPEPRKAVTSHSIVFTPGDLKALLIKSYEQVEGFRVYGQRFEGRRGDDPDDIHPDQFHRFVQAELFERSRGFIMDRDYRSAVWNFPVFRARFVIERDATDPHVMRVSAHLTGASPFVDYGFIGSRQIAFHFTYALHGQLREDGDFAVRAGEWTGDSVEYHPDFVTALPEAKAPRTSLNRGISTAHVEELLAESRR